MLKATKCDNNAHLMAYRISVLRMYQLIFKMIQILVLNDSNA